MHEGRNKGNYVIYVVLTGLGIWSGSRRRGCAGACAGPAGGPGGPGGIVPAAPGYPP